MARLSRRFLALSSLCLFLFSLPAAGAHLSWAQYKAVFKAYRYPAKGPGDSLMYRLCMPYHYDSTAKYPIIICLHGVGERGADDSIQVKNNLLATVWADSTVQNRFPCFVCAPQCPGGNYQWTQCSWNQNAVNYDTIPASKPLTMAMKLLDSLARIYPIDTNRLYIVGLSMGGWGTWDAIIRNPGKFAAAIPICGGGDTSKLNTVAKMPIWTAHGTVDPTIPVTASRAMITAIQNRGQTWVKTSTNKAWTSGSPTRAAFIPMVQTTPTPQLIFNEFSDGQHDVWTTLLNDTLVFPWVFSKSKAVTAVGNDHRSIAGSETSPHSGRMVSFKGRKSTSRGAVGGRAYSITGRQVGEIGPGEKHSATGTEVLLLKSR